MRAYRLNKPVLVTGKDYWGRKAYINLSSANRRGWWWETDHGEVVPIDWRLAGSRLRRLVLSFGQNELNVVEHIFCLRWTGLDGVIVRSSSWPPHDGSAETLWQEILPRIEMADYDIPWLRVGRAVVYAYPNAMRQTKIEPLGRDGLEADVYIDYDGLGEAQATLSLPFDEERYRSDIIRAKSQGVAFGPFGRRTVGLVHTVGALCGRPLLNPDWMVWPQEQQTTTESLRLFMNHRILDLCGAMALCHHEALPNCRVVSDCSGHKGDLEAIRLLFA